MPDQTLRRQDQGYQRQDREEKSKETDLRSRLDTFEEALAQQRSMLIELKDSHAEMASVLENFTKSVVALRSQMSETTRTSRDISDKFERMTVEVTNSTAKVANTNVEVLQELQKQMQAAFVQIVGSKVLSAVQTAIGAVMVSGLGYLWWHFIDSIRGG